MTNTALPGLKSNFDLSPYLTLKTQTTAEFFYEAKTKDDIVNAYEYAKENSLPFFMIGGGSNLVILKDQIKGLVIRNRYIKKNIDHEDNSYVWLRVSSGYPISLLVKETVEEGYQGLEYQKGLPGTVGGALYMNSKWTRPLSYIGDCVESVELMDKNGELKIVQNDYFDFSYDYSNLQQTHEIALEIVFKLKKTDPVKLIKLSDEALEYRKKTQPFGVFSSGCFFKNIDGKSAGQMIDQAGLKDMHVGDFYVSNIHANFIVNKGKGKAKDLKQLLKLIKERVKEKMGITLEEEVIIIE